mgnify:CR=1 FL=1
MNHNYILFFFVILFAVIYKMYPVKIQNFIRNYKPMCLLCFIILLYLVFYENMEFFTNNLSPFTANNTPQNSCQYYELSNQFEWA